MAEQNGLLILVCSRQGSATLIPKGNAPLRWLGSDGGSCSWPWSHCARTARGSPAGGSGVWGSGYCGSNSTARTSRGHWPPPGTSLAAAWPHATGWAQRSSVNAGGAPTWIVATEHRLDPFKGSGFSRRGTNQKHRQILPTGVLTTPRSRGFPAAPRKVLFPTAAGLRADSPGLRALGTFSRAGSFFAPGGSSSSG